MGPFSAYAGLSRPKKSVIVAGILIVVQIIMVVGLQEPATLFWRLGQGVAIACVILGVLYWGNLWTARKYWRPRKAELEAIADSLHG